ncbi:MAG: acylphosphatase [Candidatus Loosdrechtia sp.]|uniref:acylphosphatase n=1 Tax=Candidatus Loosdrechtia sp. TaxID=3101272 RepID=UPI003A60B330|nr:MAG: acylphosphatase [Candidatus Jettenia sp. AMX2]
MPLARGHISAYGKVQGVFFRSSVRDKAQTLDIRGWVRNCSDGSVEAVFEGEKDAIEKMVQWCTKGPAGAVVEKVDVQWEDYQDEFDIFSIVY